MLSKKMTVSLMSLITIFALVFVSSATAGVLGEDFKTTIMLEGTGTNDGTAPVIGTLTTSSLGDNVTSTGESGDSHYIKVVFAKEVATHLGAAVAEPADAASDADKAAYANYLADFSAADIDLKGFSIKTGESVTVALDGSNGDGILTVLGTKNEFLLKLARIEVTDTVNMGGVRVIATIAAGGVTNGDPADKLKAATTDDTLGTNAKAMLQFDIIAPDMETPKVARVRDLPPIALGPTTDPALTFYVDLSEEPKEFKKDHIDIKNATVSSVIALPPVAAPTTPAGLSTVESMRLYPYLVTITPKYDVRLDDKGTADIVFKIKSFEDKDVPPKKSLVSMPYTIKVNSDANLVTGSSGTAYAIPKEIVIPQDGYLVIATGAENGTYIENPGDPKHGSDKIARRSAAFQQTYNMIHLNIGHNLEGFLIRGGTIAVTGPSAGLVISEIMWGSDAGSRDRQWIEIANTSGADITTGEKTSTTHLILYEPGEQLPTSSSSITVGDKGTHPVLDLVSTLYKGTNHWSIAGKGQSGRTEGKITEILKEGDVNVAVDVEVVPTDRLISMERVVMADGTYEDGTMEGSWGQSRSPSQNFMDAAGGLFVGSPGTSAINPVADPVPEPEPEVVPPASVAMATDIMITEIMVDTGGGRLPQWIELTNVSGVEKSLAGWSVEISNDATDADAIGTSVSINLSGTLGVGGGTGAGGTMGKSLLLVAGSARSSSNLAGSDRVVDISTAVGQKGRYTLLSAMGFIIKLLPPQTTGVVQYGDMAGNLDAAVAWDIPMDESGRSSIIRREMLADGMMTKGTDANGWVLASGTSLVSGPATWYGSDEDAGTPGYDAGGPLPVELSHFRPARDKETGAVVITWSTQSELNNAGFFIKRAQQRDGQFKVINATMVPGAGTTSEKQFYTFTDTTAQPNVVYYYQIEDVSLDGQRQTLTNGIRLKGHIGAAGKLTTSWGELKSIQ